MVEVRDNLGRRNMAEEMVTVLPIVGWTVAAHPSGTGLLVIRHIPGIAPSGATQEQIDRETVFLQYGIGAEQASSIAVLMFRSRGRDQRAAYRCARRSRTRMTRSDPFSGRQRLRCG